MKEPWVGRGIDRVDGRAKVTGSATYAAEVAVANVGYAVIVGSTITKGRLANVDTRAALRSRGVIAVITPANAPRLPGAAPGENDRVLQLLQDDQIRYDGQPIALVIADTLERAEYAASLVAPRYEAATVEVEIEPNLSRAVEPKSSGPVKTADSSRGDFDQAFAGASVKVSQSYVTPIENHNPMEPHATLVVWQGEDRLTVYDSTQGIFGVRKRIAAIFGLPPGNVRVISKFVGGGFGCKGTPWSHVALAAMAAKVTGRAVKLVLTRMQMFNLVGYRPRTIQQLSLGADPGGQLVALEHKVMSMTSRFDDFMEPSANQSRMLYQCANVKTSMRFVRLDVPTPTYQRAPGESSGSFAEESAMDELAWKLGMNPLALRIRNNAERDQDENKPFSSKSLLECYQAAAERFDWARWKPHPRALRDGRWLVGLGMATATYPARQNPASASAKIRADGTALVLCGTQDIGTGTYTILTQISADALGLPIESVHFDLGDTEFPEAPGSGGSTTAASAGSAVRRACLAVRDTLAKLAVSDPRSPLQGLSPDALEADGGRLISRDDPGKSDRFAEILARAGRDSVEEKVEPKVFGGRKDYSTHAFGAQFAEVRVDPDLGEVRVHRVVGAFAAGQILNPKTARSQFLGGITWGIGMALMEKTVRDSNNGRAVTRDLADYHVPVHADIPAIEVIMVDEHDPHVDEVGAKGVGEIGITGVAAAIANACYHATGIRVRELPLTPDKFLEELKT